MKVDRDARFRNPEMPRFHPLPDDLLLGHQRSGMCELVFTPTKTFIQAQVYSREFYSSSVVVLF